MAAFLEEHENDVEQLENGKIRFKLTGMEFPLNADTALLSRHLQGRAMRRARVAATNAKYDFDAHKPYIVPDRHRDENKFLFCHLTSRTLPKNSKVVEAHVNGKKYKRRLKIAIEKKQERERILAKRKARAERAQAARQADNEKGEDEDEGDALEESNNSNGKLVLDRNGEGSDSDDQMADVDVEAHKELQAGGMANKADSVMERKLNEFLTDSGEERNDDGGADGEEEQEDNFWTRGNAKGTRSPAGSDDEHSGNDSDDSDEWSAPAPKQRKLGLKPNKKGDQPSLRSVAKQQGRQKSEGAQTPISGKRKRGKQRLPKKLRQPRRKQQNTRQPSSHEAK